MKVITRRTVWQRIVAFTLSVLLIISMLPISMSSVHAATIEHPDCVTISVTDTNGNPLEDATVSYTIQKKESAIGGDPFETVTNSGNTDSNGVIEVLDSASYVSDCLVITASVSKSDYETDDTTLAGTDITSEAQNFNVSLTASPADLDIEGVIVEVLEADYNKNEQELVSASATTEDVIIEYSTDNSSWSTTKPKGKEAGDYPVYVKISKDGYKTYFSGEKTAKIKKINITGIDITEKQVRYKEDIAQELVTLTGSFEPEDTINWYVNDVDTGSDDVPTRLAVGNYTVKLVVNRGSNYNEWTKTVMAQILNAQLDLTGLEVVALDGVYTGTKQEVVKVNNRGNYALKYQLDDGDETIDDAAWVDEIPTVINAGSYIVWVKAVKENYDDSNVEVTPAEHAVAPYNVYVAKDKQHFEFDNSAYNSEDSTVEVSSTELENGKIFDFSATDSEGKASGTISYSVELAADDSGLATIDPVTGLLTVNGAGEIIVKATLTGNENYEESTIQHKLNVFAKKNSEGQYVSFGTDTINYIVGNVAGISNNVATKTNRYDRGIITYSIENADSLGLSIGTKNGSITVSDYGKLISAIEVNNGLLNVNVKATKTAVIYGKKTYYPEDSATYTLKIKLADIPSTPYTVFDAKDLENELISANGDNGWYKSTVVIKPVDGYQIIRADALTSAEPSFVTSVKFGEITGGNALDQGAEANRSVYLKNIATGEITKKIVTAVTKMDNMKPYNLEIDFPECEENEGVKYYDSKITVTFVAYDNTSGVTKFNWEYTKDDGASDSILDSDSGSIAATLDTSDPSNTKYVGKLTLPRNAVEQLKGNLKISAIDVAGNTSDACTDTGVFVVDTIAPTQTVTYQLKDGEGTTQTIDTRHYFSNEVEFIFNIVEANFFANDVEVTVSKNGAKAQRQILSWVNTGNTDEHEAKLVLKDDADYVVSMKYKDRAGKKMTSYTSEIIVVDKKKPVIEFEYKNYTDSATPQVATIKITEHNFRASDIEVETIAKNIAGTDVTSSDLQRYLSKCEWTSVGDVHTATISNKFIDAIYELTFNYKDLALNAATEVKTGAFIVDRTAPKTSEMSISYSTSLLEKMLSAITFGFYNPSVDVTFTAHDSVSGIDYFTWSYEKEAGVSDTNVASYADTKLVAIQDTTDKTKYTATVTLPKNVAEQIRGGVAFTATDKYNNTSNKLTDRNHVLIVDTIAPTMNVEYTASDNSFGGKEYYNKSLTATFTITEANFYKEDVKIKLKKNDDSAVEIVPNWVDSSTDVHVGTYTIEASEDHANDGDYVFIVEYKDRSNNEMATYISETKVIDTTKPIIKVEYSNTSPVNTIVDSEGYQRKYFASTNTATITITEHNFNETEVNYTIIAKDVAGNQLNADSLHTKSAWTKKGDDNIITITYPGDANYTFDMEYTDLAKLQADDYNTDYFTVDTTKPTDLQVTYSTSIIDTVLSTITFGFYDAKASVTISATDNISGVNSMKYSYLNAEGVSNVNVQLVDEVIDASYITKSNGDAVGTATFEIPKSALTANNQFNGTVSFTATDRANNEADYLRDTKRIVVDNIAPTATVEYNAPVQQVNGISYYDGDVNATVTINEANFYAEDVNISVTRDGSDTPVTADWSSGSTDVHTGTFTLSGDGDYFVNITYSDKSSNVMQAYVSEQMTIDTEILEASITVNGQEADGKAFKDEVVPAISFEDKNFESCEVKLLRTSFADKNVDVTEKFISGNISTNETGGNGSFDTFEKIAENDGIYTLTAEMKDKAGHTVEKSITFTVNRYGSVYEYNDYLISLIKDGGAYVQSVDEDFVITEYNADRLLSGSLNIEISRDGKPLENSQFTVSPEINETVATGSSGWYQYAYTLAKDNFASDGVYKIAISSKDATGNSPENNNYEDMDILFRVDSTAPEITSISGLEDSVINATEQTVKYTVYDTIGLESVSVYVGGKEVASITDFTDDANNYAGTFTIKESSSAQAVRLVVTDLAGNVTDTDADDFTSSYAFSNAVTVSTNIFVRWFANKAVFFGSLGGGAAVVGGIAGTTVFFRRRKLAKIKK